MKKSDFYFDLPENQIAQVPVYPRDSSKLLVYNRQDKTISDKNFSDVIGYLNKGDVLVLNKTRVIPARIFGTKISTGAKIEFLLNKRINYTDWQVLCKPAKRAKINEKIEFSDDLSAVIIEDGEEGLKTIRFEFSGVFEDILSKIGQTPLPTYIHEKLEDTERYQTVYSKIKGSSAAPTAGLHFTDELLKKIQEKGVKIAYVLLHVGLGTFRPVKTDNILDHKMHSEYFEIDQENCDIINKAKLDGGKIIAVGTTSVRVLESVAKDTGFLVPANGDTNIFIYPPYKFKIIDRLITNFHLPESTLIMLVSALCTREETLRFYNYAVKNNYRFFSFGDSTIIL